MATAIFPASPGAPLPPGPRPFKAPRERLTAEALALLLAGAVWVVYLPVLDFGFVNLDDNLYLTGNPLVAAGLTPASAARAFSWPPETPGLWIPLTTLSFQADATLWGSSPRGFHRTNLLIFAVCASLLVLLLWGLTGEPAWAAVSGRSFTPHPPPRGVVAERFQGGEPKLPPALAEDRLLLAPALAEALSGKRGAP